MKLLRKVAAFSRRMRAGSVDRPERNAHAGGADSAEDRPADLGELQARLEHEIAAHAAFERALAASQRELHGVLSTVTEGVALWGADGRLRYANPALSSICAGLELKVAETHIDAFLTHFVDVDGQPLGFSVPGVLAAVGQDEPSRGQVVQTDSPTLGRRWFSLNSAPVKVEDDAAGAPGVVTSMSDITELKNHTEALAELAHFDSLTGLPNRRLLQDRMRQLLSRHDRMGKTLAICYLDLDGFKEVNDGLGHQVGDRLLKEVAVRLLEEIRANDTVARLGGDEFVVLLADLSHRTDCEPILYRILESLSAPYRIDDKEIGGLSVSIGVTLYPSDRQDADTLLRHADHAMYSAKSAGKNNFQWFDPSYEQRLRAQQETLKELREALRHRELIVCYQPRVDCHEGRVVGAEALLRWQHPILGLLPPIQFVPLVERSELAASVGQAVIEQVLQQACQWRGQGLRLQISVNLFMRQLQHADFVLNLHGLLDRCGCLDDSGLQLEITENTALEAVGDIGALVRQCQHFGVRFALDDFGTGYSSLDHLRRIPADALNIDCMFIRDLLHDRDAQTLVKAVIGLGRSFERDVVAKGVESAEQMDWLLAAGCRQMQGFHFAEPMPAEEFIRWVDAFHACRVDPTQSSGESGYRK